MKLAHLLFLVMRKQKILASMDDRLLKFVDSQRPDKALDCSAVFLNLF